MNAWSGRSSKRMTADAGGGMRDNVSAELRGRPIGRTNR
jgi:hypothetical protein